MTLLRIKIIGTEDTQQKMLMYNVKEALNQLGMEARIHTITDWEDIMNTNIIQSPALVIRNQVIAQGFIPSVVELKKTIRAFIPDEQKQLETPIFND